MKSFILASLASLLMPFFSLQSGSLKEITKPYTGAYECTLATLGDTDLTEDFKTIYLTLENDGIFSLTAIDKHGRKRTEKGDYLYDCDKEEITFLSKNKAYRRSFPLKNGEIFITLPFGSKTLRATFERK